MGRTSGVSFLSGRMFLRLATAVGSSLILNLPAYAAHSAAREWNEQLLAAIRIDVPNPPGHARNLFHTAVAMYDAWAAYDQVAVGCIYDEKVATIPPTADAIETARHEAISYAAYRVLRSRFANSVGAATTLANLDAELSQLGYSPAVAQGPATNAQTPAELGKRIGDAILTWGASDGYANVNYPGPYNSTVNPNMASELALSVLGNNGENPSRSNMPLGVGIPLRSDPDHDYAADTQPNFWQPLGLSTAVTQNGIPTPGGIQSYVGVQGMATTPFALTRSDALKPWIELSGPSRLSLPGFPSATDASYKAAALDVLEKSAKLNDPTLVDISPAATGNNPLGTDLGSGYTSNPATGQPYSSNWIKRSDFARVIAEFWADGPNSETPPGHWHVLANEIADDPSLVKKLRGVGPTVNDLEWDVKTYFALGGAVHDAACEAWALKRYYSGPRPITAIRYMGTMGQSSNPAGPSHHPQGLLLEPGVVEVVTSATASSGGKHQQIWDLYRQAYVPGIFYIGRVVVFSWPGEDLHNPPPPGIATNQATVRWMFASDWLPFQRKTFNTPAFPGYISGHSTFSRSAAEVLALMTGSTYFPGGLHHHLVGANTMQIDRGPSMDVDLQWATYYDAADQAGQSRRWGGIHPSEDDYAGRIVGVQLGQSAFLLAEKYWSGTILNEPMQPAITRVNDGGVRVSWMPTRGMYHKVQASTDAETWTDATSFTQSFVNAALPGDVSGSYTDLSPSATRRFYRILRSPTP